MNVTLDRLYLISLLIERSLDPKFSIYIVHFYEGEKVIVLFSFYA